MKSKTLTILLLASALTATGCKRAATGQVVAVVNGEEVSLSELNGELQRAGAQGGDKKAVQAAALQGLIDRKLLVQAARERGIDKDPEYLQQQRRLNDELMISMLGKQVTKNVPVPSTTDVDQYVASHPDMFGQRTIYALDQIQFAAPEDRAKLKALEADHSLDEVAATLTQMGIKFARQKGVMDSAQTPPGLIKQITQLPPTEPFVLASGGRVVVSVIADKRVQPLAGDNARQLATQVIRRDAVSDIAKKQVKQARDAAKIEYQPGFAPAAGGGAAAAK
ncbi:MAG TPA: EpsD family peptidyl-prolyl cis-trans isomerase [Sphingomonas sp.]|nr:EpsD family peptidyl-prolyl cis-trans isomerase [Sphingomonas sp.]